MTALVWSLEQLSTTTISHEVPADTSIIAKSASTKASRSALLCVQIITVASVCISSSDWILYHTATHTHTGTRLVNPGYAYSRRHASNSRASVITTLAEGLSLPASPAATEMMV